LKEKTTKPNIPLMYSFIDLNLSCSFGFVSGNEKQNGKPDNELTRNEE